LRQHAAVEDVDYRAPRGLDRALFSQARRRRVDAHDNLILCGPTGIGKRWLACALGHKACRDNRYVLYQRAPNLFADLAPARGDGRYARIMRPSTRPSCSFSTIGVSNRSTPAPVAISTRPSKNAMDAAGPS
jgi:DNA replication protein DnaC